MFKVIVYVTIIFYMLYIGNTAAIRCDTEQSSIEGKLRRNLFCNDYDKSQRPVKHHKTATNISMSIYLKSYYVDEAEPSLHVSTWLSTSWKDELLTWDRAEYGIEMLNVESSELWRPTISSYNDKQFGTMHTSCTDHQCELKYDGEVSCISPCSYEARCSNTNVDWPFDVLDCMLYFSSWLEYSTALNINAATNVSTSYLREHDSWKLLSAEKRDYNVTNEKMYPLIDYRFSFERHMGVYTAVLTPGFMVVALSVVVLWLESSSAERLYILCATCMGHFSFLEYLYWHLPYHTEDVPKMLLFFRDSLLINAFMLIFTIILKHADPKPQSAWRQIDRWALTVASTSLGRVLLQRGQIMTVKKTQLVEESDAEREHYNQTENGNVDSIHLVIDGSNGNASVGVRTEKQQPDLVIIFLDRIMLVCCLICYLIMISNLFPKKH